MSPVPLLAVLLDPSHLPADAELMRLLWDSVPDLQLQRARVAEARGDLDRAGLLPNPGLELSASTLPLGPMNPTAPVTNPALEVPAFAVAVSELIELGKRGPRQGAARRALEGAVYEAREQLRQRFWDVRAQLGEIAAAQARIAALTSLAADAARLSQLQRTRVEKGDASALDLDRARLDEEKLTATLGAERERLAAQQRACAQLTGGACDAFAAAEAAAAFLSADDPAGASREERGDLKALEALEAASEQRRVLAERRVIPDPTVRLGYLRDQYLASGNWQNSLFVGVSLPLPVFDHGQADARLARSTADAARRAREQALESTGRQLERLQEQARGIEGRRAQVHDRALPLARDVVARLDAAVARGAAPVQDLLLARRALVELQLDANDLELAAFHVRVTRARLEGRMPPPPEELKP